MAFSDYQEFFSTAFVDADGKGQQPFDYQHRLALDDSLPSLVDIPTGVGKSDLGT